jgi:hypothetical protein
LSKANLVVNSDDTVTCPNCQKRIGLGPGGIKNFQKRHYKKKTCNADAAKYRDSNTRPQ